MIPSGLLMISSVSGELPAFIFRVEMSKVWKLVGYIGGVGGLGHRMSVNWPVRFHGVEVGPGWANGNRKQADKKVWATKESDSVKFTYYCCIECRPYV
jgi:hypothetical protein